MFSGKCQHLKALLQVQRPFIQHSTGTDTNCLKNLVPTHHILFLFRSEKLPVFPTASKTMYSLSNVRTSQGVKGKIYQITVQEGTEAE